MSIINLDGQDIFFKKMSFKKIISTRRERILSDFSLHFNHIHDNHTKIWEAYKENNCLNWTNEHTPIQTDFLAKSS